MHMCKWYDQSPLLHYCTKCTVAHVDSVSKHIFEVSVFNYEKM